MPLPINRAVTQVPASGIRRVFNMARDLQSAGKRIYPFHLGAPDFDTPQPIKQATINSLEAGNVHYAPNAGIPELREVIAESVNRKRGTAVSAEQVIVTVGACEAISLALMATLEPGTDVLVPTPCWMNYLMLPRILGANVVEVPMQPDSFLPDVETLGQYITPKTRALLINTPSNPTGTVIPEARLAQLVAFAQEHDIWLLCDEIYEDILYTGNRYASPLSQPGAEAYVMLVSGLSKTYSMTGWRLGYLIVPPDAVAATLKVHQYLVTSATSFTQWGAVVALRDEPQKADMLAAYQTRRTLVVDGLRQAGLDFVTPGGAFYAFPRIPAAFEDDIAFCDHMLHEHGLALVPGSVFGAGFAQHFRLCFACATDDVADGLQVLVAAMRAYA